MTEKQLRALVARILVNTDPSRCDGDRAQLMIKGDPDFMARFEEFVNSYEVRTVVSEPVRVQPLLKFLGLVNIPTRTGDFIATEKFVINTDDSSDLMICGIGSEFKSRFLHDCKVEKPIAATQLRYHRLRRGADDLNSEPSQPSVISELGGEGSVETTLSAIFFLLEKQGKGQNRHLLVDGRSNIFYIRDNSRELCVVDVSWSDNYNRNWDTHVPKIRGWYISATRMNRRRRRSGELVFSRNPFSSPSATALASA